MHLNIERNNMKTFKSVKGLNAYYSILLDNSAKTASQK